MDNQKFKEYKWWQIHEKISSTTDIKYLEKQIKNYFYFALLWSTSFIITIIMAESLYSAIAEATINLIMIWGIYRKKRWAAIAFFVFFVIGRIMTFAMDPKINYFTVYILICFAFFYIGMLSVLRLNKLKQKSRSETTQ